MAGQLSAGITQLVNKAAYDAGANSPRRALEPVMLTRQVVLAGAVGAGVVLAIQTAGRHQREL
jgi:hypothetical protein